MYNNRLFNLMQSEIRNMSIECDKINGINLSQGICDLPLPNILVNASAEAVKEGINYYTHFNGIEDLRYSIAKKLKEFNNINIGTEKNIVVTCGATGALYSSCLALLNPGDEVILFEPFYGYHQYTLYALDLIPIYIELSPPNWNFNINELEMVTTSKTKAIIINTPSNPCGKVFTKEELNILGDFCIKHDLIIFTDEIYEYFTYDGNKHISPASIEKIKDRVVTISGYSKTFSITGWRIGYSIANDEYSKLIGIANDLVYVCAPAPFQKAVSVAINTLDYKFYNNLSKSFNYKRDKLCSTLYKIGLTPYIPQGAYYVLADISILPGNSSKEKCMWLLNNTGIAVVPGNSFYHKNVGRNLARFCFAKDDNMLNKAIEILLKLPNKI